MRSDCDLQEIAEDPMAAHCHQLVSVKEKYIALKLKEYSLHEIVLSFLFFLVDEWILH